MSKILVERSRIAGRVSKGRPARNIEDEPRKQSMKKTHKDRKTLNENLQPLKRFLHSKVGQHWDKVFSEISENLKTTSTVQQHVRDHVWDFVHKNVSVDGKIVSSQRKYGGTIYELSNNSLYVCPKTGILKKYSRVEVKRAKFDKLNHDLNYLSAEKSQLYLDEAGNLFKVFLNKKTKEWSIFESANVTHAKHDFKLKYNVWNKNSILKFFHDFEKKINFKNPYFAAYVELINKSVVEKKPKVKADPLQVGAAVEVSRDGGKTWEDGTINRIESNTHKARPTFWVTLSTKNMMISPYMTRYQIRIKK